MCDSVVCVSLAVTKSGPSSSSTVLRMVVLPMPISPVMITKLS